MEEREEVCDGCGVDRCFSYQSAQVPRYGFSFVVANYVPRVLCLGDTVAPVRQTGKKIALLGMEFNQANQNTEMEREREKSC
jgi:hypothetical protein